jgi:hypothetical protein
MEQNLEIFNFRILETLKKLEMVLFFNQDYSLPSGGKLLEGLHYSSESRVMICLI